jgi:hypothetical protein
VQVRATNRAAFTAKQQALRAALAAGDRLLAARQHRLLAATFTTWRIQVGTRGTAVAESSLLAPAVA